jgi:Ca2+-transporting ATPase
MKPTTNRRHFKGLSDQRAAERIRAEGYNEIPSRGRRNVFSITLEVLKEPMFLLLVGSGLIYLMLGDPHEALMLLGFVVVIMATTIFQEQKTERALEALRRMASPRALVIRDGRQKRIPGREVVRGDTLLLAEGDRVPADGVLLSANELTVDESLLSGESVPVRKVAWAGAPLAAGSPLATETTLAAETPLATETPLAAETSPATGSPLAAETSPATGSPLAMEASLAAGAPLAMAEPGGDDLPFVYSGTLVVQGQGVAEVLAIGSQTEMGKIGKSLQQLEQGKTLLQKKTKVLVRDLALVGTGVCIMVIIIYGLTRGNWLQGILAGLTLAMAILPEEIPVILTVFLALGAWRISKDRVLTRRVSAIESLGSATVLCVDKTGTLTQNLMGVQTLYADNEFYPVSFRDRKSPLPEKFHSLVEYSVLASEIDPFDPMEKAFYRLREFYLANTEHVHPNWILAHEYSLSPELLAMSHVWKSPDSSQYVIAAKGAVEAISSLCHLTAKQNQDLAQKAEAMANEGLRVMAVARALFSSQEGDSLCQMPESQHDFNFRFLGMIGLADPPRPAAAEAIRDCQEAGLRVVMITGDYPATAQAIGRQIGLRKSDQCITGPELTAMSEEELREKVKQVNIFARMVPGQKVNLVQALKANGEVVAMTGDGVNDSPALKAADIGVAMGSRGTDVAREAASLVILDDDFSSIVQAVRLGRRILDNIKKAIVYTFAIHTPIIGLSLIPLLMRWPLLFSPIHIVFLELIIDPACSVVFEAEPEEEDVMKRPPRDPHEPLFGRQLALLSILQGVFVLVLLVTIYGWTLFLGQPASRARALTFTTLILANLTLILTNRSWSSSLIETMRRKNLALWIILCSAPLFLGLALYLPWLRGLFQFAPLSLPDLLRCLGGGVFSIILLEGLKICLLP